MSLNYFTKILCLSHKSWKRPPIEIIDYIACSLEDPEQEKNCELNRSAVYPTIKIISPGLRMRGDIRVSQRETDYYILFYTHSNGDHLRCVLEMSICPRISTARREILRWVGVGERKLSTTLLASSFFPLRLEWIAAVTDDRNNWIVGCLKHAHFKRMAEWILGDASERLRPKDSI